MTEQEPLKKPTLSDFIKDNSTLVTSFAAFVALTVFSFQLDNPETKIGLSATALFGALLLGIELFSRLPPRPYHWRLQVFVIVLLCLFVEMGSYWLSHFRAIWVTVLIASTPMVLVVFISALVTLALRKAVQFVAARGFKRSLDAERFERGSQIAFIFFMVLLIAIGMWGLHRMNGHQFQIPRFFHRLAGFPQAPPG
jgi:hypothetical protein